MSSILLRLSIRRLIAAGAVFLSALLTLAALIGAPAAQAGQHAHAQMAAMDLPATHTAHHAPGSPAATSGIADVTISDLKFNPPVITITAGSTVRWTNSDPFTHTTTSDVGSLDPWDSGDLGPTIAFSKTFNTPGTYPYHCAIHSFMHGTVVVVSAQPPTTVLIDGPSEGAVDTPYTFTASVNPLTATQPITYLWQATGQSDVRHLNGLSDTIVLTWMAGTTGTQWITATASNDSGAALDTHFILFGARKVYLPAVMRQ